MANLQSSKEQGNVQRAYMVGGEPGDSCDSDPATLEGVVGAYDWLFLPMGPGTGGDDQLFDDPVGDQADPDGALGPSGQLALAALGYAASAPVTAQRKGTWRKRLSGGPGGKGQIFSADEFFELDEERFACTLAFEQVAAAMHGDPWAWRWLMAADAPEKDGVPPRTLILEIFAGRDYVLQTRVAYEMWRLARQAVVPEEDAYPVSPLNRRFLMEITAVMADHNLVVSPALFISLVDIIRANPGIEEPMLWHRWLKTLGEGADPTAAQAIFDQALSFLELEMMLSRSQQGGWYFTGRNPIRKREEIIAERRGAGYLALNRSWSSWF